MMEDSPYPLYRRSYDRFSVDATATLIINNAEEKLSRVVDLSACGIGIYTDYPLDEGEQVNIVINPTYFFNHPLSKHARVAWCHNVDKNLWRSGLDFGQDNKISFA